MRELNQHEATLMDNSVVCLFILGIIVCVLWFVNESNERDFRREQLIKPVPATPTIVVNKAVTGVTGAIGSENK